MLARLFFYSAKALRTEPKDTYRRILCKFALLGRLSSFSIGFLTALLLRLDRLGLTRPEDVFWQGVAAFM